MLRREVTSVSHFQPIRTFHYPSEVVHKRVLHRAHPLFPPAHHHNFAHLLELGIFAACSTSSPSACLRTILFCFFVIGGGFSPHLCWRVVVYCISVGFSNKLRHLWWPNLCQTMLTQSLLTKPFSKQVRRHAVLVYSFNFQHPCNSLQNALL